MGWKDDARRTRVSDWIELESFPGYKVRVKKYSIAAQDDINETQRKLQRGIDKKALSSLMKKSNGSAVTEGDILEMVTEEELQAMLDVQSVSVSELSIKKIRHGVFQHTFCDGGASSDADALAKDIVEYGDIAVEIIAHIEDFNRPLAMTSASTSEMSQNGSTGGQPLNTETSIQTEESQQS